MNDRYLFKAKRIGANTGIEELDWTIGNLIVEQKTGRHFIVDLSHFSSTTTKFVDIVIEVDPSTVSQCTGLKDKNGKLIFENDVVSFKHERFVFDYGLERYERTYLLNKKEYKRNYVAEFCNTPTHYGLRFRNGSIWFMVHKMTIVMHDAEVIGNIFDNPELLER